MRVAGRTGNQREATRRIGWLRFLCRVYVEAEKIERCADDLHLLRGEMRRIGAEFAEIPLGVAPLQNGGDVLGIHFADRLFGGA